MLHIFVEPDGRTSSSMDFPAGKAPKLAPNKGRWLPATEPAHDPAVSDVSIQLPIPANATSIPYVVTPRDTNVVRNEKIAEVEQEYTIAVQRPVSYMGRLFQADKGSQEILAATLTTLNALGSVPPGFAWWDIDNNPVNMNLAQINGLAQAIFMQGWAAFQNKQAKKKQARLANNNADITSISW